MKRSVWFFMLAWLLLAIGSCSRNDSLTSVSDSKNENLQGIAEVNGALEDLARSMAKSLAERPFRVRLKQEIGKKFDGDFNVLFRDLMKGELVDGKKPIETIAASFSSLANGGGTGVSSTEAVNAVTALAKKVPRLNVSIPVHFDTWDEASYAPVVAYNPYGVDDTKWTEIRAFDMAGNVYRLDARRAPDFPVVVLGVSERTDDDGNVTYHGIEDVRMAVPVDDEGGGGGGGGGGGTEDPWGPPSGPRVSGMIERIHQVRLTHDWDFEPWSAGDPEVAFKVKIQGFAGLQVNDVPPPFGNFDCVWKFCCYVAHDNGWHGPDVRFSMFNWYRDAANNNDYGPFYIIFWYEDDTESGKNSATFTTSFKDDANVTIEFKYDSGAIEADDPMGIAVVNFGDSYRMYDTGAVQFYVTWKWQ